MPSSALSAPSCIAPPRESERSSSCSAIVPPHSRWRWSASRSTPAFATGCPSSVKPAAPCSRSAPISVSSSPSRPRVSAPRLPTGTCACSAAVSRTERSSSAESIAGSVLGIAITAPNPPAAAALVPLSMSSLCSCPGLRRCTCGSKNAGSAYRRPSPSTISISPAADSEESAALESVPGAPSCEIAPPRTSTSKRPSTPAARSNR